LILIPVLTPMAIARGIEPIHFGILVECNVALHLACAPVGGVLFTAPPHNGDAIWDFRGRKAAWVARGMVAMMRGDRPAILLNPKIYANT
jgi:TRAP-type C4-dicarboxylate transport system permease large subunit